MYLCFDPSLSEFGYSVITDTYQVLEYGCIKTDKEADERNISISHDKARRTSKIGKRLVEIVGKYDITKIISELPQGSQSAQAADCLGMARAIVQVLSDCTGIPLLWVKQHDSKITVFGKPDAEKDEIVLGVDINVLINPERSDKGKIGAPWTGVIYRDEAIADSIAVFLTAKYHEDYDIE